MWESHSKDKQVELDALRLNATMYLKESSTKYKRKELNQLKSSSDHNSHNLLSFIWIKIIKK